MPKLAIWATLEIAPGRIEEYLPVILAHKARCLSGSSGKLRGLGQERDAGLPTWAMTASLSPDEGMAVRVPVGGCLRDGLGDLVPGPEAAPGQGERT